MSVIRSFFNRLLTDLCLFSIATACLFCSCNGKHAADQRWVDSVLNVCDSLPDDTLVYDMPSENVSSMVDEYFNDFIYTFSHNKRFQQSRILFPLNVYDGNGEKMREITNSKDMNLFFPLNAPDSYVMLLNDVSQVEDASSTMIVADLQLIDFDQECVRRLECERQNGQWMLNKAEEFTLDSHPFGDFLKFYNSFSSDSVYQIQHIAQPLSISIPDEDDENDLIEGTIDAAQFPVFAPVLPKGKILMVDYGQIVSNPHKVVMVKCGMGSGMMDIMSFEEEEGEWKLVSMEQ